MKRGLDNSLIRIYDANERCVGIGVLISKKYFLTCAHVVADALGLERTVSRAPKGIIRLDFPFLIEHELLTAQVVEEGWQPMRRDVSTRPQRGEDIAVLRLHREAPKAAYLSQFVQTEQLENHEIEVYGVPVGNPQGVWAGGQLVNKLPNGWMQLESSSQLGYRIEPGFSGSPIWDKELQAVVGITVATDPRRPDARVGFAIPTEMLALAWPDLAEQAIPPCPYRGLFAFREQDARFFFGRTQLVESLIQSFNNQAFTTVIGPSGSGKTSIIFAGLIPRLRTARQWLIETFRPGDRPFWNLAAIFVKLLEPNLRETDQLSERIKQAELLAQGQLKIQDILSRLLEKYPEQQLLLVIDQFEELYTLCPKPEERQNFLNQILVIAKHPPFCKVIVSLRADFMGFALSDSTLAKALQHGDIKVGPMTPDELREAIIEPANLLGIAFEEGLVDLLISKVAEEPGSLPLLEFTLKQLWSRQRHGRLTFEAYKDPEIGGVETALVNYASDIYSRFSEADKRQARRILVQLVRPGEGTDDTRRLATRSDLGEESWDLITKRGGLADSRLVVTGRNAGGQETVEVVHEALIQKWDLLKGWMEDDRRFRTWQEQFRVNVRQWNETNKDKATLLRGKPLTDASAWKRQRPYEFSQSESSYIQRSLIRERIRQCSFFSIGVILSALTVFGQRQFAGRQFQQQFSAVLIAGSTEPSYIHILPRAIQIANQRVNSDEIDEAIEIHKNVLKAVQTFEESASVENRNRLTEKDLRKLRMIKETAERELVDIISQYYIPQLQNDLSESPPHIGFSKKNAKFTDFEHQFTGALKTTYRILLRKPGLGADEDDDGRLGLEEILYLPCGTLKEIEELWHLATKNDCGFYGEDFYESTTCDELSGETLSYRLFESVDAIEKRITSCPNFKASKA
ncbi:trypsin-like peptidase domain-containing protein [Leptothoe sp. EHU-05/26/07-4]